MSIYGDKPYAERKHMSEEQRRCIDCGAQEPETSLERVGNEFLCEDDWACARRLSAEWPQEETRWIRQ